MSYIKNYIEDKNNAGRKVLSVFITAGFPDKSLFMDAAKMIIDSGADMLEIGIPFSDPLADGSVIQQSSQSALAGGTKMKDILNYTAELRKYSDIPLILMGYANPVLNYGLADFFSDTASAGANGVIIPDVPLEEYNSFYTSSNKYIDRILLTTPASSEPRVIQIDRLSEGFVYCVSVTGTTGGKNQFTDRTTENIIRTRKNITNNKMLIGFGITSKNDVERFSPNCDGVIVGSAVIRSLMNDFAKTASLIKELSGACG